MKGCRITIAVTISDTAGAASETVTATAAAGVDMITYLVNKIIVGFILAKWELSFILNCYKEKGNSSERGHYRGSGFPIRGKFVGAHFGQNGQKLHGNYKINIFCT